MSDDDELKRQMLQVCGRSTKDDYAFTVQAVGALWDVYRFSEQGKKGMFAFRVHNGQHEIGFFRAGDFTEEQVAKALPEGAPN